MSLQLGLCFEQASSDRPLLMASVTLEPGRGGISLVARVLHQVLAETWQVMTLESGIKPTLAQKLRFAVNCCGMQIKRDISMILFDQIGIAQVQNALPKNLRTPYAVFIHGIEVWRPLDIFERGVILGASAVFCNSKFTHQKAISVNPWLPKTIIVPLCLPATYLPSTIANSDFRPIVLTVGRLGRDKGHRDILNVWPRVLERVPNALYWIVGNGEKTLDLQKQVNELGISRSVKFWGFVPDSMLPDIYAQCAVFAMPSYGEGFGLVYLEAMRHKKPCIGSVHDAASEVIVNGETGLIVDQQNPAQLEDSIVSLLQNPELCYSLGVAGYERERNKFTYQSFRDVVVETISRTISS